MCSPPSHPFCLSVTRLFCSICFICCTSIRSIRVLDRLRYYLIHYPHSIILLQDQFDVTPYEIGLVYLLSNLFMFITEFIITPYVSSYMNPTKILLLSLFLLTLGKAFQLVIPNLCFCSPLLMCSMWYILFCVLLNTVGEEMFATTFVNILAKVSTW